MLKKQPIDCVLAVTYLCNSKCVMCDIWKNQDNTMLSPEKFLELPSSLKYINVSGGEPFLRNDIVEVVANIKKATPKAKIVISSNGFLTDRIIEKMKQMPEGVGVALSLDGIGEMHDKIRGIPNGFNMTIKTLEELKKIGIKNLRLAFTVSTINVQDLSKVYDLAEKHGVELTLAFAQSSEFYFGGKENFANPDPKILKEQFDYIIKSELKKSKPKRWLRAYFAYGLYNFAKNNNQLLHSEAGTDYFFLDPFGKVFPSVIHNYVLGNVNEKKFSELWNSKKADDARNKVKASKKKAWMICTARTAIIKHPFKVFLWILKNKINYSGQ
ncbi:MAG: radical SAM protein [Patescibacteria group bacterium]